VLAYTDPLEQNRRLGVTLLRHVASFAYVVPVYIPQLLVL